ncbi:ATP-binding cassette domain-containing protein [Bacillaceae bacterium]
MIEVKNLVKEFKVHQSREGLLGAFRDLFNRDYKLIRAVDDISFEVQRGEFLAYIGENGAGKSTTIKMLTGILSPTSGSIKVNGYIPYKQREQYVRTIGVVFGQRSQLWWDIGVIESFHLLQKVYRVDPVQNKPWMERIIEELGISDILHQPVRKLSLGQRMRCELAAALLHKPDIVFLDEPTIGLDVLVKQRIRDFLKSINETEKTTILLTTHDISDIEALCKRVIVLDKGKIIYNGTLDQLKEKWGKGKEVVFYFAERVRPDVIRAVTRDIHAEVEVENEYTVRFFVQNGQESVTALLNRVITNGSAIKDVKILEANTEEIVRRIYAGE